MTRTEKWIAIQDILGYLHEEDEGIQYYGNQIKISAFANINDIVDNSMIWIKNSTYLTEKICENIQRYKNVLVVSTEMDSCMTNCIITEHPKAVYFSILSRFFVEEREYRISEKATVMTDRLGHNINIGPGCYIGPEVEIENDVYIHPNVTIEGYCHIGSRTEIFSGVVIGMDGFGYYQKDGIPKKVPHFKGVVIGEDVEIGANTCIDRGCLGHTVIGNHVKIDNLCHIGHNVVIEDSCMIVAGSILCGSVCLENGSYIAPGAIIKNQLEIGAGALVGMGAVVTKNVESEKVVAGVPAHIMRDTKKGDI